MNSDKFWKNQKIIVTGGAGFLGRFVVSKLKESGCDQIFVPRSREFDLRKEEGIKRLYRNVMPTMVIHLAAITGGIAANRKEPGRFFYDNAIMGLQLMEFARQQGVGKFVAVGTICAYPKIVPVPFREEDLWSGYPEETNAPYGLAKKMMLVQAQAYRQQYDFKAIYLLPVNLYGPGDNFDLETSHVIPALIRKFDEAKEKNIPHVQLWGDGSPSREFIYVQDAAEAIVLAAEKYSKVDPVNLGSGIEIPIRELALMVGEKIGYRGEIVWDTSKPNGQPRRCLDVSRALNEFGFRAKTSFDQGLQLTLDWYLHTWKKTAAQNIGSAI